MFFHDVNSVLYTVTNIPAKARTLCIKTSMVLVVKTQPYLRQQLLTASEKIKFWETPKQDGKQQKIQGSIRLKQPKARNIEVIK